MIKTWQLQEAKNKFSRVVEDAISGGTQVITRRGEEVAVVISYANYQKIVASRGRLSEFFHESPLVGIEIDLVRDESAVRKEIEL